MKYITLLLCLLLLLVEDELGSEVQRDQILPPKEIAWEETIDGRLVRRAYSRSSTPLNTGGQATVYRGKDTTTGGLVALRIVSKWSAESNTRLLDRTNYEHSLQSSLRNDNVLGLVAFFQDDHFFYFVTEYAERGDLLKVLQSQLRTTGFPERESRGYMKQILKGLQYLHDLGIIHRDLKLDNVLMDKRGRLVISDLGFAVKLNSAHNYLISEDFESINADEGFVISKYYAGTLGFFSPEVCRLRRYSKPSDIYALGIILLNMLTRTKPAQVDCTEPIPEENIKRMLKVANRSPEAVDLVLKMLNADPEARPTVEEILTHAWVTEGAVRSINTHRGKGNKNQPDVAGELLNNGSNIESSKLVAKEKADERPVSSPNDNLPLTNKLKELNLVMA